MRDGIVTKPFNAFLHLEGAERRLEVGETVPAGELSLWGRSVDHLVNTGRLALVTEIVAAEASIETLVATVVRRADELEESAIEKLNEILPQVETDEEKLFETISERAEEFHAALLEHGIDLLAYASDEDLLTEVGRRGLSPEADEAEGDGATGADDGDPGGVGAEAPASQPSANDPDVTVNDGDEKPVEETELTPETVPATDTEPDQPAA